MFLLQKRMEADREKTRATFRQLHKFLEEQEKHLLDQAEEVEKEIARRRDEYLSILSREIASLDSLIQEVEEEKQQQSVSDLLQVSGWLSLAGVLLAGRFQHVEQ